MPRLVACLLVWVGLAAASAAPSRPLYEPPESPKPWPLIDLSDTTWSGTTFDNFAMTVTFKAGGTLIYHGDRGTPGTWSVDGNRVYFEINNKASEHRGMILGDFIKGTSTNDLQKLKSPLSLRRVPP
jgi:hypothetical protein